MTNNNTGNISQYHIGYENYAEEISEQVDNTKEQYNFPDRQEGDRNDMYFFKDRFGSLIYQSENYEDWLNFKENYYNSQQNYNGKEQQPENSYEKEQQPEEEFDNEQSENVDESFEDTSTYISSNSGTPIENQNIQPDVNDGNDLDKLDFSSQYSSPNGGNDTFSGTAGTNTYDFNALLNAKSEIYQKHADADGKIDWQAVAGENDNYHDHWVDSLGQDTIVDFSGSGGDGDKINIVGHTIAVSVIEESENQVKLGLYSDQGADGNRGNGAHDFDVLGTITVNHDGNFDYGSDVSVNANVFDGAFEFA